VRLIFGAEKAKVTDFRENSFIRAAVLLVVAAFSVYGVYGFGPWGADEARSNDLAPQKRAPTIMKSCPSFYLVTLDSDIDNHNTTSLSLQSMLN
jgi:hypothetical protein